MDYSKRSGNPLATPADHMDRALALAARGRGRTSPNPMVGAVIVSPDDLVVGSGFHERAGQAHAEVRALDMAGDRARGATLYCTLEPCSHVGRTGPCVARIVESGIARVVASVQDPNPFVSGRGFAYLKTQGIAVEVGLRAEAATSLNGSVLHAHAQGAAVRHHEGRDQPRRLYRRRAGAADDSDLGGGESSCARRSRRSGRDRRRRRDDRLLMIHC